MNEEKMSFLDHLSELRMRILWSLLAVALLFGPAYYFSTEIFEFLMKPLVENLPQGSSLIFTRPAEGFTTYLKVSFFAAVVLAALDDAIADDKKYGNGREQIARWARSRDGREVLSCAGIDPNERVVKGLMEFVGKGVRTSVALSRAESERRNAALLAEAAQAEAA